MEKFKPEQPESHLEKLNNLIKVIADETNNELQKKNLLQPNDNLLDDDCRIRMHSFERGHGGPYDRNFDKKTEEKIDRVETSVKEDCRFVEEKERQWQVDNKASQDRKRGLILEKLITAILHKFLKSRFLVMRAAAFDDIENGADNVIVDKETGSPVCAFDEVSDVRGGTRYQQKMEKIIKKAEQGGTYLKYGVTFNQAAGQKKLIKQGINNTPTFYLPLSEDEMKLAMEQMNYNLDDEPTEIEKRIFDQLLKNLEEQQKILLADVRVHGAVKKNLQNFSGSLDVMKQIKI